MEKFFSDCLERFAALHGEVKKAIQGLDRHALDWVPTEEANSINILVTHLAAAELFWAVDAALGRTSERVRSQEFIVRDLDEKDLVAILDSTLEKIDSAFQGMQLDDLKSSRYLEQRDLEISAGWGILHALEHTGQHVGHIQLTAQLWRQQS